MSKLASEGSVLQTSRCGLSGRVSMLNTLSKSPSACSENVLSRPSSYSKVENDVPVAIHFDHVFKFRVGHDRSRQHCCKFHSQTHASLTHETERSSSPRSTVRSNAYRAYPLPKSSRLMNRHSSLQSFPVPANRLLYALLI